MNSRPQQYTQLPLHAKTNLIDQLNSALEKGLDMAGVKTTKTGPGEKEQAYVVKTYTMLFFILISAVLTFCGLIAGALFYMDLKVVNSSAHHEFYVDHLMFQKTQNKLVAVQLELQKALDSGVRETERVEEFRSFMDKVFGELREEIGNVITESERKEVDRILGESEDKTINRLNVLVNAFKGTKAEDKKRIKELSDTVVEDIDVSNTEKSRFFNLANRFKGKNNPLTRKEKKEMKYQDMFGRRKGFGHIGMKDGKKLTENLDNFQRHLETNVFPVLNPKVILDWEDRLAQTLKQLDNDDTVTDLSGLKQYVEAQLGLYAPKVTIELNFDGTDSSSLVTYFEKMIVQAKLAPHRQELLDLFAGWKQDSLTGYQVLANIENIAKSENIEAIFAMFN